MAWFKREKKSIEQTTPPDERRVKTEGLWIKCASCRSIVWKKDLDSNSNVCPKCQHHFRLSARERLDLLLDGPWIEHDAQLASNDPLHFVDTKPYAARLKEARRKLGVADAVLSAEGVLAGRPVMCCSMEFGFIGGSMGAVVGEKVTRAIERAIDRIDSPASKRSHTSDCSAAVNRTYIAHLQVSVSFHCSPHWCVDGLRPPVIPPAPPAYFDGSVSDLLKGWLR